MYSGDQRILGNSFVCIYKSMILMEKRELFDLMRLLAAFSVAVKSGGWFLPYSWCRTADFDHYHSLTYHLA